MFESALCNSDCFPRKTASYRVSPHFFKGGNKVRNAECGVWNGETSNAKWAKVWFSFFADFAVFARHNQKAVKPSQALVKASQAMQNSEEPFQSQELAMISPQIESRLVKPLLCSWSAPVPGAATDENQASTEPILRDRHSTIAAAKMAALRNQKSKNPGVASSSVFALSSPLVNIWDGSVPSVLIL